MDLVSSGHIFYKVSSLPIQKIRQILEYLKKYDALGLKESFSKQLESEMQKSLSPMHSLEAQT